MIKLLRILLLATLSAGCTTGPIYVKWYDSVERPIEQLALLKPTSGIRILSMNGDTSKAVNTVQVSTLADYEIGLLPGTHTIEFAFGDGRIYSMSTIFRTFTAEAGHRYLLRTNFAGPPLRWNPVIEDVTDRKECWSVRVDTAFGSCK
jgi:hypothetical protein